MRARAYMGVRARKHAGTRTGEARRAGGGGRQAGRGTGAPVTQETLIVITIISIVIKSIGGIV